MKRIEVQNHDGICRLITGDYEIVLAEGDSFLIEIDDNKLRLRLKPEGK